MKNLTLKEKRANELEALNNALNYHKKEVEELQYAFIQVSEQRTKRPYHLIFKTSDGVYLGTSCECDYMEMNAFIHGYCLKTKIEEKFKNHVPKQKYILDGNSINDIEINEQIFDEELFEYKIIHRESFIDELYRWIGEANPSDRGMMIDDVKMLSDVKDEYIFSSISTNDYIYSECGNFDETCKDLLELNETL